LKSQKHLNLNLKKAAKAIWDADQILIVSHTHPDGDTLGSQLALGLACLSAGKRAVMVNPDGIPRRYQFLPGSELVLTRYSGKPDVVIAVDCGSLRQTGRFSRYFQKARNTIQLDHHDFGEGFGKILVVEPEASAVGEIVYELLKILKLRVTAAIATCLLTSIIVDTGAFRFSNIRGKTFKICADLITKGVNVKNIVEEAYWKKSIPTIKLEAKSVQNMKFEKGGQVVWTLVRQADFKRLNGMMADVDGAADDLRSIEGVKIAVLMRETGKGTYRVSLRSAIGINVAKVAQEFGGGGHHNAAGCSIKALKTKRDQLIRRICELA
jgi:bifunctional oligoribonuclease and PAP phosphatase NrnA